MMKPLKLFWIFVVFLMFPVFCYANPPTNYLNISWMDIYRYQDFENGIDNTSQESCNTAPYSNNIPVINASFNGTGIFNNSFDEMTDLNTNINLSGNFYGITKWISDTGEGCSGKFNFTAQMPYGIDAFVVNYITNYSQDMSIGLMTYSAGSVYSYLYRRESGNNVTYNLTKGTYEGLFKSCQFSLIKNDYYRINELALIFDWDNMKYSIFLNGNCYVCCNQDIYDVSLLIDETFTTIRLGMSRTSSDKNHNFQLYDNLIFGKIAGYNYNITYVEQPVISNNTPEDIGDATTNFNQMLNDMGFDSVASRIIFALIMLVFINFIIIKIMVESGNINANILVFGNIIVLFGMVFFFLIPPWIVIFLVVLGSLLTGIYIVGRWLA